MRVVLWQDNTEKLPDKEKIGNWKLATELCTAFDTLIFETLNLEGMKRLWGRKVSDHAFYQFLQILEQKCAKHGKTFVKIGQWTATTKPCSDCGYYNKDLSLSDRQWTRPRMWFTPR